MEQNGTKGDGGTPPYTAFASFKTMLKNMKEHGVPSRIDRSVLGSSFSNAVGSQILTALKFLGLTDSDSHPTEALKGLVDALDSDEWATTLSRVLRAAYSPLFQLDLETASPNQFNELFRRTYSGADDVQRKSSTFFLNAARDAGIKISPYIEKNKKPRAKPAKKRAARAASKGQRTQADPPPPPPPPPGSKSVSQVLFEAFDPSEMPQAVQQATLTVLTYLKSKGL